MGYDALFLVNSKLRLGEDFSLRVQGTTTKVHWENLLSSVR